MTITVIETNKGKIVSNLGTSGFTVTARRNGESPELQVLMEFDITTREEAVAMIGTMLTQLEELHGESFVAEILAHYALETEKKFMEAGDHQIAMIRGGKRGKPPKRQGGSRNV